MTATALVRSALIWAALALAVFVPLAVAATSPLLAFRQPIYGIAGFAGVVALALLLIQPLLAGGYLPGVAARHGRRVHRATGVALVTCVVLHVVGLWITSPPDVIDTLLFAAPAPFAPWGVIAMWGMFAAAGLAAFRHRLRPRYFRIGHGGLVLIVVLATVAHAMLIDGTMGLISKTLLCVLAITATFKVLADLRVWRLIRRSA
jgi:hypothetical protein